MHRIHLHACVDAPFLGVEYTEDIVFVASKELGYILLI